MIPFLIPDLAELSVAGDVKEQICKTCLHGTQQRIYTLVNGHAAQLGGSGTHTSSVIDMVFLEFRTNSEDEICEIIILQARCPSLDMKQMPRHQCLTERSAYRSCSYINGKEIPKTVNQSVTNCMRNLVGIICVCVCVC